MYSAVIEEYLAPTTLEDALAALARHRRDARIIAGGMSLMQLMRGQEARVGGHERVFGVPRLYCS